MITATIRPTLTDRERRQIREQMKRWNDTVGTQEDAFIALAKGGQIITATRYTDDDEHPSEVEIIHRAARNAMLACGRTFDYTIGRENNS